MEVKLPVPVKELAAVTKALCKIHGKQTLFMRQVGMMLQIYKPQVLEECDCCHEQLALAKLKWTGKQMLCAKCDSPNDRSAATGAR